MKCFALAILLSLTTAQAATADYLESRNRLLASMKIRPDAPDLEKRNRAGLAALEKELARTLPPFHAEGFPKTGKINLQTLVEEEGFGQLDGLAYVRREPKTTVIALTPAILADWLASHAGPDSGTSRVPREPQQAIRSEAFYTQAIGSDAAVAKFADLSVDPGAEASAAVLLVRRQQDIGPGAPDEIVATVLRGDRVLVASQPVGAKVAPIPPCEDVYRTRAHEAERLLARYNAGGSKDEALFARYTKAQEEGDTAFRGCFAERIKDRPEFPALARQAQALVDTLR